MKQILLATAVLLALTSNSANAYFIDGNKLNEYLIAYEDPDSSSYLRGSYSGYVTGVADAFDEILFCLPNNSTVRQVNAVVSKYLKNNPEDWTRPAHLIITAGLKEAFPCKEG